MKTYAYAVKMTDGRGNKFLLTGAVQVESGDFRSAMSETLEAVFLRTVGPDASKITCGGPWTIESVNLEAA